MHHPRNGPTGDGHSRSHRLLLLYIISRSCCPDSGNGKIFVLYQTKSRKSASRYRLRILSVNALVLLTSIISEPFLLLEQSCESWHRAAHHGLIFVRTFPLNHLEIQGTMRGEVPVTSTRGDGYLEAAIASYFPFHNGVGVSGSDSPRVLRISSSESANRAVYSVP